MNFDSKLEKIAGIINLKIQLTESENRENLTHRKSKAQKSYATIHCSSSQVSNKNLTP